MKANIVLALLCGICATGCFTESVEDKDDDLNWDEFAEMLSDMPEEEKYEFVREHVLKGYELAQQGVESEELTADHKLSLAIFTLVKEVSDNIEKDKKLLQRNSTVCFDPPVGCIDSGDAAARPT